MSVGTSVTATVGAVGHASGAASGQGTMREQFSAGIRGAWALLGTRNARVMDLDQQLVERCLAGDETAWEDLVKVHTRRVYAICYRFTGSDAAAQDLTQDVFLRVFKSLRSYRVGEGSFAVWLTRLSRNLLIDHYRRTKSDRVTDSIENQLPIIEGKATTATRADGMLAGREASEMLQAGLQRLSPELREAVILRDLEEMDYKEIAQTLNVPEGTVKSRLNRGRAELARVLRQKGVRL
jgi:RNA polymerase sigma-70 factor, ECF subfamily